MNRKIIGFFAGLLFIASALPAVGTLDNQAIPSSSLLKNHDRLLDNGTISCYAGDYYWVPPDGGSPDLFLVWLFLRNEERSVFRVGLTDFHGEYSFDDLPLGHEYHITAMILRLFFTPMTISVEITAENPYVSIDFWLRYWFDSN